MNIYVIRLGETARTKFLYEADVVLHEVSTTTKIAGGEQIGREVETTTHGWYVSKHRYGLGYRMIYDEELAELLKYKQ